MFPAAKGTRSLPRIIKSAAISETPVARIVAAPEAKAEELPEIQIHEDDEPVRPVVDWEAIRQQAEVMMKQAEEEAAACVTEAQNHAQTLFQQAQAHGFQQGYQEGFDQGKQAAKTEMQQVLARAAEQSQRTIAIAERQVEEFILNAERQIIEIVLAVTSKILARELEGNPMIVLPIVKAALEKVRDQDQIMIRVHPEDYELVLQARRDLQILVGREQSLQIAADQTVAQGGCVIDTAYGSVDAQIDTQLSTLRAALEEALP